MSETTNEAGANVVQHFPSTTYQELSPNGYLFTFSNGWVKQIFYRDQSRVVAEHVNPSGGISSVNVQNVRVQDISLTFTVEDFVRNAASNLSALAAQHPSLMEKYGIHLSTPLPNPNV